MTHKLQLNSDCFCCNIACTGEQLFEVLKSFSKISHSKWLVSDIEGTTHHDAFLPFNNEKLNYWYFDTKQLLTEVKKIIQFESGVFCLIEGELKIYKDDEIPFTEASEELQLSDCLIEVRAFDFSYFEVYSNNLEYIKMILKNIPNKSSIEYFTV